MEELTKELEELRNFKLDVEQRGLVPVMAVPADITMLKKREMEQQLVRLKMVCMNIRLCFLWLLFQAIKPIIVMCA